MPKLAIALVWLLALASAASSQSRLVIQGEVYFDGQMTLHVIDEDNVGELAYVAYGLDPLDPPVKLGAKGYYYIGTLVDVLAVAGIPAGGQLDVAFTNVSSDPAIVGLHVVLQAFVNGKLSNPATLPLDEPCYEAANATVLTAPVPQVQALLGDRVATGDLNDDGATDIIANAWFEDAGGVEKSGAAYVFWGPNFATVAHLTPPTPREQALFGMNVLVGDYDGDEVDDLIVAEGSAWPILLDEPGYLHFYEGGQAFSTSPSMSIASVGTDEDYLQYGRGSTLGDFDDNGSLDIAIGIEFAEVSGFENAGRIEVHWGPAFSSFTSILPPEPEAGDYFGSRLATGDINGDGIADLIESSGRDDIGGEGNIGSIHGYTGPNLTHVLTIENPLPDGFNSRFGEELSAHDIDGDGATEIITRDNKDRAYICWSPLFDSYHLIEKPPSLTVNPFGETAYGHNLAVADANMDGAVDVFIADPFEGALSCAVANSGTLFVALAPYFATFARIVDVVPSCANSFTWSLAVDNIDVDAQLELVVGSSTADPSGVQNAGQISLFCND